MSDGGMRDGGETKEGGGVKVCASCGLVKPADAEHFPRRGVGLARDCNECWEPRHVETAERKRGLERERRLKAQGDTLDERRASNAALKLEMHLAYGGKCACCGEGVPDFLQIRRLGPATGNSSDDAHQPPVWQRLKRAGWPPTHELLCVNCRRGMDANGGACPHADRRPERRGDSLVNGDMERS